MRGQLLAMGRIWATREALLQQQREFMNRYGVPWSPARGAGTERLAKPKWGQPGRHRRRKNRLAARALEQIRQVVPR